MNKARIDKGMWWDRAWSLVEGCTPVSEGCKNCWSAKSTNMRAKQKNPKIQTRYEGLTNDSGRFNGTIRLMPESLDLPLRTRQPTSWAVWNDLFHEDVPFEFIKTVLKIAVACPQHTFQVLTKRADKMLDFYNSLPKQSVKIFRFPWPPPNVWLGVTAENQATADERIPLLLQCPAAVRFVSIEPMLGPVDLMAIPDGGWPQVDALHGTIGSDCQVDCHPKLDWVIVGGETGPGARPMHPDWVRSVRDQCQAAGVPFFFKQWGAWAPVRNWIEIKRTTKACLLKSNGEFLLSPNRCDPWLAKHRDGKDGAAAMARIGNKDIGRCFDGRMWNEMPATKAQR